MATFFTSDTHFGHRNILEYDKRPFGSVEEMDAELIKRWNQTVKPSDTVYHLGDFCLAAMGKETWIYAGQILEQLNGAKHLLWGNHDSRKIRGLPMWQSSQYGLEINLQGCFLTLCHYAMMVWNKSHYGQSLMLHGHTHGRIPPSSQRIDVGCMNWDYRPVSLHQITMRTSAPDTTKHKDVYYQNERTKDDAI